MRAPARICLAVAASSLLAVQVSCGDSSGPRVLPASIAANSSVTLAAAPGTAVAELPSVLVRDASGAPLQGAAGVFSLSSGGWPPTRGKAPAQTSGGPPAG